MIGQTDSIIDAAYSCFFEEYNLNYTKLPRLGYPQGATPIELLAKLSRALGMKVNLFVKGDDLLPLDFCIAYALTKGAETLVTHGAVQSNHCRLTASWSAKKRLECHLVLKERINGSYKKDGSGNYFLFELL